MQILVVGSGFAGLSAAARLAKLRHQVTILERADQPGGLLGGLDLQGQRVAAGPQSVTLPGVFRDLFRKSGRPMDALIEINPAPGRHHRSPGRRPIEMVLPFGTRGAQHDAFMTAFGSDPWSPWIDELADPWNALRRSVLEVAEAPARLPTQLHGQLGGPSLRRKLRSLSDRRIRSIATASGVQFGFDMSRPRRVPAVAAVSHYVERNFGRWNFDDDLAGLATALTARLAERRVTIETGCDVAEPVWVDGAVVGVRQGTSTRRADLVVWAAGSAPSTAPPVRRQLTVVQVAGDHPLPDDFIVHGRRRVRGWRSGQHQWALTAAPGVDAIGAVAAAWPDLRDVIEDQLRGTGTILPQPAQTGPTSMPHPTHHVGPGLWLVGSAALPGAGLEVTGMGTAALAEAIGPAER